MCLFIHRICVLARRTRFFFNQPTKYRRQSGARRSTTVRTIVVIILLYHSSYPLEHPLFSRTLRLLDRPIILDLCPCCRLFSMYKLQLTSFGSSRFFFLFFLVIHRNVKFQSMNILICNNTHRASKDNIIEK